MNLSRITKAGAAVTAFGSLVLVGATGANADEPPTPVTSGHVDIVEVECEEGVYEVVSHIGTSHVEPEDIGSYQFILDESASNGYVEWQPITLGYGYYKASTGNDGDLPDIGFVYEAEGEGCAAQIGVDLVNVNGPAVTFNAEVNGVPGYGITSTLTGARLALTGTGGTHHVHGDWFYGPVTHTTQSFSVGFNVYDSVGPTGGNLLGSVSPVNIQVQP